MVFMYLLNCYISQILFCLIIVFLLSNFHQYEVCIGDNIVHSCIYSCLSIVGKRYQVWNYSKHSVPLCPFTYFPSPLSCLPFSPLYFSFVPMSLQSYISLSVFPLCPPLHALSPRAPKVKGIRSLTARLATVDFTAASGIAAGEACRRSVLRPGGGRRERMSSVSLRRRVAGWISHGILVSRTTRAETSRRRKTPPIGRWATHTPAPPTGVEVISHC